MSQNRKASKVFARRKGITRRKQERQAGGHLDFGVLEDRKMLAQIFWENRADFDLGADTFAARKVIDQALLDWGAVISSFNYRNVGQGGWADSNVYKLTIDVDDLTDYEDGKTLAYCTADEFDGDGKPFEGSMVVGSNINWWYDPTPAEDSEFSTPTAGFQGPFRLFAGSANLSGKMDLYSVIVHELGHGLGFSSHSAAAWHNRINSNDYFVFNDNTTAKLERSASDPNRPPAHTGSAEFPNDLMNPDIGANERRTISALDARILRESYGYTINDHRVDKRAFITTLNSASRTLTVWGDLGTLYNYLQKVDTIHVNQASDHTSISVNGLTKSFLTSSFDTITVRSRSAPSWDVINVQATIAGKLLKIDGGTGGNRVYLSPGAKNLSAIRGNIVVYESDEGKPGVFGTTELFFNDDNNDAGNIFRIRDSHVVVGFGADERFIQYSGYGNADLDVDKLNFRGGSGRSGSNGFYVNNKGASQTHTYIRSGNGNDYISVTSLGARGGEINGWDGTDTVTVGDQANFNVGMNTILGPLKVDNSGGRTDLTLDDSRDASASRDVRIHNNRITGLGPSTVSFHSAVPGGIRNLNVLASNSAGGGGNKFTVFGTPQNRNNNLVMNLSTGRNNDKVFVQGTGGRLNILGEQGQDTVNVGKAGKLEGIHGIVNVENAAGATVLNIVNSEDTSPKSFLVSPDAVVVGSSFIFYNELQLKRLAVYLGDATPSAIVNGTPQNAEGTLQTWLSLGAGNDTVQVRSTLGSLLKIDGGGGQNTVNVGYQGKLNGIQGNILIFNNGSGGYADINVDGSNDEFGRFAKIEADRVRDLTTGEIRFDPATLSSLVVSGSEFVNRFDILDTPQNQLNDARVTLNSGKGNDTVNVLRIRSHTTINGQSGSDVVSVGEAGKMQGISKPLVITNSGSYSTINLDDSADTQGRAVTLDVTGTLEGVFGTVEGLSPGSIWFKRADLRNLNIWGTPNLDFFRVRNTAQSGVAGGSPTTIHAGGGSDTVNVRATTSNLNLNLRGGSNLVTIGNEGGTGGSQNLIQGKVSVIGEQGYSNNFLDVVDRDSPGSYVYLVETGRTYRTNLQGGERTADIDYSQFPLDGLAVSGANTYNVFEITGTPQANPGIAHGGVHILGGTGTDFAYVFGTETGRLDVELGAGLVQYAFIGDATHSLDAIRGDVHVTGGGYVDTYISDVASMEAHLAVFERDPDGEQIVNRFNIDGNGQEIQLNRFTFAFDQQGRVNYTAGRAEAGTYNQVNVNGVAANIEVVGNGGPDYDVFSAGFGGSTTQLLNRVTFNSPHDDSDVAYYYDYFKPTASEYSIRTNPDDPTGVVIRSVGQSDVIFNGLLQWLHYSPLVGANRIDILGTSSTSMIGLVGDGDRITLGSHGSVLGGNMDQLLGTFRFQSYQADDTVEITLDDSGNADTAREAIIEHHPFQPGIGAITGIGPTRLEFSDQPNWRFILLAGSQDDSILMTGSPFNARFEIDGGEGNDILIGNGGNRLFGGAGRDLLVAGSLASVLDGGLGEDLLIGGSFNDTSAANLNSIRELWSDLGLSYESRVSILLDHLLTEDKVTGNDGLDSLTGGANALDLFFGGQVMDWEEDEQVIPLT